MRRTTIFCFVVFVAFLNFSCANLKSSLSKSDSSDSRDYSRQTPYAGSSVRTDSIGSGRASTSYNAGRSDANSIRNERKDNVTLDNNAERRFSENSATRGNNQSDQNQLIQYSEMDKLADLILYELDITEKRKDSLLDRFKNSSSGERENITQELNKLDANQLTLYKAYVQVYKDGKSDWPAVRKNVENTLLTIRGIGNK